MYIHDLCIYMIYVYLIGFEWLPCKVMTKNMMNLKPQFFYFLK